MEDRFHGGGCFYGDSATLSRERRENRGARLRSAATSSSSSLCIVRARESLSAPRIPYRGAAATVVVAVVIVLIVVVLDESSSST